ncbi:glycerol-3-phosphate dehydrogenase [Candidatus Marinamargulisbacteria bacterium SCGC AAA071-K20]|nr:glycerol-3-phosphate dehydrogenase [Candidatus Marinamargulisbacteria bacterium SCGC AAA071-K20]
MQKTTERINSFLQELSTQGFSGDIESSLASRLVMATDNSIYQILPQAVLFPKSHHDISMALKLSNSQAYEGIVFAPRGGGTGTNGQSLTTGIIIDCSRHMTKILDFNKEDQLITVQPGVILDDLNNFLKPHKLFFAPTVSPSNRATIGGMIGTDASGKGSRVYGKTCDHIISLKNILFNGDFFETSLLTKIEGEQLKNQSNFLGQLLTLIQSLTTKHQTKIKEVFFKLSRCLTGYNLAQVYDPTQQIFNLNTLIAGSEGTLAITSEATLKLTPIPNYKRLIIVHYPSLNEALLDAPKIVKFNPLAVETLDEHVLKQVSKVGSFNNLKPFFQLKTLQSNAIHYVEIVADTFEDLEENSKELLDYFKANKHCESFETTNGCEISELWQIRKQCVGLLLKTNSIAQPIPFIEDGSVPIEHLSNYINDFTNVLKENDLSFGFYGHVDVGCIHIRPGINLQDPSSEKLIQDLTSKVANLVKKYDGVLWGEHGRGFRSETSELFFGLELTHVFREIKSAFDPFNKMNPGKIASPLESKSALAPLLSPLRGQFDRQINKSFQDDFSKVISCNGNGACFSSAKNDIMCPSYKVTFDRQQSPKGRAILIREWLRQRSVDSDASEGFTKLVLGSLKGCLSCKACVSDCPVEIDIPHYKVQFLYEFYKTNSRPFRDNLVSLLEKTLLFQSKFSMFIRPLSNTPISRFILKLIGLIDLPQLSKTSLKRSLKKLNKSIFDVSQLDNLDLSKKHVFLVQDAFTSFYEADLVIGVIALLEKLKVTVHILPFYPNGKPLHVLGFLDKFKQTASKQSLFLNQIAAKNVPIIGIEPSMVLTYSDEYKKSLGSDVKFEVLMIQDYILSLLKDVKLQAKLPTITYTLLGHCTEKSQSKMAMENWQKIFKVIGLKLIVAQQGCCGMAGLYGHEVEHYKTSLSLYDLSWRQKIETNSTSQIVVTGFSCREQIKRFSNVETVHPIKVLLEVLTH